MLYGLLDGQPLVIKCYRIIALGRCGCISAGIIDGISDQAYGQGFAAIWSTGKADSQCICIAATRNTGWGSARESCCTTTD